MHDRIKQIRLQANLKQAQFAERIGVSKSAVQAYEYGRSIPKSNTIRVICEQFGINPEWLVSNVGEMHMKNMDDQQLINEILTDCDDFQKACILAITRTEGGWEKLRDVMSNLYQILNQEDKSKE